MLEINSENTVVSGLHISTPPEPYRAFIELLIFVNILFIEFRFKFDNKFIFRVINIHEYSIYRIIIKICKSVYFSSNLTLLPLLL
jgi:hypothetical protein